MLASPQVTLSGAAAATDRRRTGRLQRRHLLHNGCVVPLIKAIKAPAGDGGPGRRAGLLDAAARTCDGHHDDRGGRKELAASVAAPSIGANRPLPRFRCVQSATCTVLQKGQTQRAKVKMTKGQRGGPRGPWGRRLPSFRLPMTACFFRKSLHSFLLRPKASMLWVKVLETQQGPRQALLVSPSSPPSPPPAPPSSPQLAKGDVLVGSVAVIFLLLGHVTPLLPTDRRES